MGFRYGIDGWKVVQALVWVGFSLAWAAVGARVALHFHQEDSWLGIAIAFGPMIFFFSSFISCMLQSVKIERT